MTKKIPARAREWLMQPSIIKQATDLKSLNYKKKEKKKKKKE